MLEADLVAAIDIGGTNTTFGLVNRSGDILRMQSVPTQPRDCADTFIDSLHRQIETQRSELAIRHRFIGIGIGAPNAHGLRGTIEHPVNLDWGETVDIVSLVHKYYSLPVFLTNDAKAAALGEMLFGGARGMKHFMVITLGTGLGCGIVTDGHVLSGASGFAGELGHTVVDPDGRECRCGKRGCLETYVSATGLVRTALALLAERCHESRLRAIAAQDMTAQDVAESAAAGDIVAQAAFDRTARILAMKLADAAACVSPEAIFLTGGLARAGDLLMRPVEKYLQDFLFRAYRGTVRIWASRLDPGKGAVLGAAALVWNELAPADDDESARRERRP